MIRRSIFSILFLVLLVPATGPAQAVSIDQAFIEVSLEENKKFTKLLNVTISNLGTKQDIKDFVSVLTHDFLARIWYLQGRYNNSYNEIRKSQELMKDLFKKMHELYVDHTREFLESYAPMIIKSKDKFAAHYLQLGFRDLKSSEDYLSTGTNYNRLLFSNKIHIYLEGIKRARRGKRYAVLAMIEAKTPRQEKPQFKLQTLDDIRNPEQADPTVTSYHKVMLRLQNMFARRILDKGVPPPPKDQQMSILEHHDDNYGVISKQKCSVLAEFNPDFGGSGNVDVAKVIPDRGIAIEEEDKKQKAQAGDPQYQKDNSYPVKDGFFEMGCTSEDKLPPNIKAIGTQPAGNQPADNANAGAGAGNN